MSKKSKQQWYNPQEVDAQKRIVRHQLAWQHAIGNVTDDDVQAVILDARFFEIPGDRKSRLDVRPAIVFEREFYDPYNEAVSDRVRTKGELLGCVKKSGGMGHLASKDDAERFIQSLKLVESLCDVIDNATTPPPASPLIPKEASEKPATTGQTNQKVTTDEQKAAPKIQPTTQPTPVPTAEQLAADLGPLPAKPAPTRVQLVKLMREFYELFARLTDADLFGKLHKMPQDKRGFVFREVYHEYLAVMKQLDEERAWYHSWMHRFAKLVAKFDGPDSEAAKAATELAAERPECACKSKPAESHLMDLLIQVPSFADFLKKHGVELAPSEEDPQAAAERKQREAELKKLGCWLKRSQQEGDPVKIDIVDRMIAAFKNGDTAAYTKLKEELAEYQFDNPPRDSGAPADFLTQEELEALLGDFQVQNQPQQPEPEQPQQPEQLSQPTFCDIADADPDDDSESTRREDIKMLLKGEVIEENHEPVDLDPSDFVDPINFDGYVNPDDTGDPTEDFDYEPSGERSYKMPVFPADSPKAEPTSSGVTYPVSDVLEWFKAVGAEVPLALVMASPTSQIRASWVNSHLETIGHGARLKD